jgi:hypothetical protein
MVAIVPACRRHHDEDWIVVTVHNEGAARVDVRAEAEYWSWSEWEDHEWASIQGESWVQLLFRWEHLTRLKVRIFRSTDQSMIFEETWDRDDVDDLNGLLTIRIHP